MTDRLSLKKPLMTIVILTVVFGLGLSPVIRVLMGSKHMWAYGLGVLTGALNLTLLFYLGRAILGLPEQKQSRRTALIFAITLKYLLLVVGLYAGILVWKLPAVTLVLGISTMFPAVIGALWYQNRED